MSSPFDAQHLGQFEVLGGPGKCYYIPEFITEGEEEYLMRKVNESSQQKWKNLANRRLQTWGGEINSKSGVLIPSSLPPFLVAYPDVLPRIVSTGIFRESSRALPNHVIINEYLAGQGIMPHQDGPTYFPAVATVSLGSHTVMQYHRFRPEPLPPSSEPSSDRTSAARSIDPKPILSLLLEPRSLVITTSDLYTSHLHAIEPLVQDVIPTPSTTSAADMGKSGHGAFANESLIIGEKYKKVIEEGGTLERDTRISLTCRVVEKVLAIGGKRAGEKGLLRR